METMAELSYSEVKEILYRERDKSYNCFEDDYTIGELHHDNDTFIICKSCEHYFLIWRETGEVAIDYQGYGAKKASTLVKQECGLKRKLLSDFTYGHYDLLQQCKTAKEVEAVLKDNGINLYNGLTNLRIIRLLNQIRKVA